MLPMKLIKQIKWVVQKIDIFLDLKWQLKIASPGTGKDRLLPGCHGQVTDPTKAGKLQQSGSPQLEASRRLN